MVQRITISGIPIWVRVTGITVLVLSGVIASSILLGSIGFNGGMGMGMHDPAGQVGQSAPGTAANPVQTMAVEGAPEAPVEHKRPNH